MNVAALVTKERLPEPAPAESLGEEPVVRGTDGAVVVAAASTLEVAEPEPAAPVPIGEEVVVEVLAGRAWAEVAGEPVSVAVTGHMVV